MKLRTGHVDLDDDSDVSSVFTSAAKLRCAWVTGTGGDFDDLHAAAEANGYRLGDLDSDTGWVAVRGDLAQKDYENGTGVVKFSHEQLGDVVLSTEPGDFTTTTPVSELESGSVSDLTVLNYRVEPVEPTS